jgi:peptidoglycan/LPS O-acetylase OafA/YrhL
MAGAAGGNGTKPKDRLDALTSLRFFAALLVFVFHTKLFGEYLDKYLLGVVGVSFFFILSGFILTYVYAKNLQTLQLRTTLRFYAARIAKIVPMHYLTMLYTTPNMMRSYGVVWGGVAPSIFWVAVVTNILLLHAFISDPAVLFSFNNVSWTLSIEMFFYALFPFLIWAFTRYGILESEKKMLGVGVAMWVLMVVSGLLIPSPTWGLPIYRLPEFVLGVLAAGYFVRHRQAAMQHSFRKMTIAELGTVGLSLIGMLLFPFFLETGLAISVFVAPAFVAMIILYGFGRGAVSQALSKRPWVFLGEISFSFYLIHYIVINTLGAAHDLGKSLLALGIAVLLSALLYLLFEEPMRKRVKRQLDKQIDRFFPEQSPQR